MISQTFRRGQWVRLLDIAARHPWVGTVAGLALVVVLVPIIYAAGGYHGAIGPSIPLFFLVPMLLASTLGGRAAGVITSIAAIAVWDFFFIPPFYTITIYYPRDVLALIVFLFDALLTGQLASTARARAREALQRASTSEALYELSIALIGSHDLASVLPNLTERVRQTFDLQGSALLLPTGTRAWKVAAYSGKVPGVLNIDQSRHIAGVLSSVESTSKVWSISESKEGSSSEATQTAQFWPLRTPNGVVGVLELVFRPGQELDEQGERLLTTLVNGAAIALEQERLSREEQEAAITRESDRLKSALLSSVSHDLRTPLAGIKAAASSLLQSDVQWGEEDRRAFLKDIDSEADRLTRLVSNLLDLSRIEAGALTANVDWEDPRDLVERVVARLRDVWPEHKLATQFAPSIPAVRFDAVQMDEALTNLIENAAKYSPKESTITVAVNIESDRGDPIALRIDVSDEGPGIPHSEQQKIFDKFYRVVGTQRRAGGTGMGLAIVKGLVEANGGTVTVQSEPGRGSMFTIRLPLTEPSESGDLRKAPGRTITSS